MENPYSSDRNKLRKSNKFVISHKIKAHAISTLSVKCQKETKRLENCRKSESGGSETFLKFNFKYKRRNHRKETILTIDNVPKFDKVNDVQRTVRSHSGATQIRDVYKSFLNGIVFDKILTKLQYLKCRLCKCCLRYAKMSNICSLNIIVIFAIIMAGVVDVGEAGVCWVARESNGKCTQRLSSNMSEEECCKYSNFAYTERELSDVELFFASAIDDGAGCKSCLDSCETAKCGSGKRCVYRKGKPKCVCAPVCRSSKPKNTLHRSSGFVPSTATDTPPLKLPKERRSFPSFLKFGSLEASLPVDRGRDSFGKVLNTNNETSTSISQNMNRNSDNRWRHDFQPPIAEALKSNRNETEGLASSTKQRRKNQRKSKNMSKRRKSSTMEKKSTTTPLSERNLHHQAEYVEELASSAEHQDDSPKSGRIIITAEKSDRSFEKILHHQNRKVSNSSSVHLSSTKQPHHNRHQSKKDQLKHQPRINGTAMSSVVPLEEKIRSGFFGHGFPYPNAEEFQQQHAHGRYYNPVCGTDGKTYKTECQLKKRACRRESTTLVVAYRGHCQTSCKLVRCLNNLTCVEDQYGLPHCIPCSISCPQDDASAVIDPAKAVCGVDGLIYKSICDINRLICATGRSIAIAYYGLCQAEANCNTIQCRDKQICLNDLMTNKPRCISCSFKCPRKRRPQGQRYQDHKICGTNSLTYHSWCQMRRESCNTGFYIDVKHVGTCHKNSVPQRPKYT